MDRTPRQPSDRVLIAGAVEDLPEIHRLLEDLPETAYGQVFVEVALEEEAGGGAGSDMVGACFLEIWSAIGLKRVRTGVYLSVKWWC